MCKQAARWSRARAQRQHIIRCALASSARLQVYCCCCCCRGPPYHFNAASPAAAPKVTHPLPCLALHSHLLQQLHALLCCGQRICTLQQLSKVHVLFKPLIWAQGHRPAQFLQAVANGYSQSCRGQWWVKRGRVWATTQCFTGRSMFAASCEVAGGWQATARACTASSVRPSSASRAPRASRTSMFSGSSASASRMHSSAASYRSNATACCARSYSCAAVSAGLLRPALELALLPERRRLTAGAALGALSLMVLRLAPDLDMFEFRFEPRVHACTGADAAAVQCRTPHVLAAAAVPPAAPLPALVRTAMQEQ
jgi:hypothetical protein